MHGTDVQLACSGNSMPSLSPPCCLSCSPLRPSCSSAESKPRHLVGWAVELQVVLRVMAQSAKQHAASGAEAPFMPPERLREQLCSGAHALHNFLREFSAHYRQLKFTSATLSWRARRVLRLVGCRSRCLLSGGAAWLSRRCAALQKWALLPHTDTLLYLMVASICPVSPACPHPLPHTLPPATLQPPAPRVHRVAAGTDGRAASAARAGAAPGEAGWCSRCVAEPGE